MLYIVQIEYQVRELDSEDVNSPCKTLIVIILDKMPQMSQQVDGLDLVDVEIIIFLFRAPNSYSQRFEVTKTLGARNAFQHSPPNGKVYSGSPVGSGALVPMRALPMGSSGAIQHPIMSPNNPAFPNNNYMRSPGMPARQSPSHCK